LPISSCMLFPFLIRALSILIIIMLNFKSHKHKISLISASGYDDCLTALSLQSALFVVFVFVIIWLFF
jgi:hypothetical protein